MEPISIIIPIRIESQERKENLHCTVKYLLQSSFVYIDILEADKERQFYFTPHKQIRYRFIKDNESIFYRTYYLNQLLKDTIYPIVGIWDADVLLPEQQVIASIDCINRGVTMCFPYDGNFCMLGELTSKEVRLNTNILQQYQNQRFTRQPSVGGAFLVNKEKYLNIGGENEGFYGWGPEDVERVKRMEILELAIERVQGPLFHLYHTRATNLDNRQHNQIVLLNTCKMHKIELINALKNHTGFFSYLDNWKNK